MIRNVPWSVVMWAAVLCLTRVAWGAAQAGPQPPAEQVFKDIQVMRGSNHDEHDETVS
jgi:hypothetical protein